nr:MAG TPA: hypothetical protein [Caudoviricetes sp.]
MAGALGGIINIFPISVVGQNTDLYNKFHRKFQSAA